MAKERSGRKIEQMIERSLSEMPMHSPIASPDIHGPMGEQDAEALANSIDNSLVNADVLASHIASNIDGAIDRGVAAARTKEAMLTNALQLPLTIAANEAGQLYGAISNNLVNAIDRAIGEAAETQSLGFPGVYALSANALVDTATADESTAAAKLEAAYGISRNDAFSVVAAWSPEVVAGFLSDDNDPEIRRTIRDSVQAFGGFGQDGSGAFANLPGSGSAIIGQQSIVAQAAAAAGQRVKLCAWGKSAYAPYPFRSTDCGDLTLAEAEGLRRDVQSGFQKGWVASWRPIDGNGMMAFVRGVGIASGGSVPPQIPPPAEIFQGGDFAVFGISPPPVVGPPPSPRPPTPPTPIPPRPPAVPAPAPGGCIPICNPWPAPAPAPVCPDPEEPEEPDPCEICNATIWFNPDDCSIKVFIDGCGPPRTERQWLEMGKTANKDKIEQLLEQHCPPEEEPEEGGGVGPIGRPPQSMTALQLCNFLPPAGYYARFSGPAIVSATLYVIAAALSQIPGLTAFAATIRAIADGSQLLGDKIGGWVENIVNQMLGARGCNDSKTIGLYLVIAVFGLVERWICTGLDDLTLPFKQQARFACPMGVLSPEQATAAVLANEMTDEEWKCLVQAGNFKWEDYEKFARSARRKLDPVQLIILRARDLITHQQFDDHLRTLGFIEPSDRDATWDASEWFPGPSDIVRFMLRDAADETVVTQFGLDEDFTAKYAGKLPEYAKGQRVSDEVMKLYWRAHWSIPSPTQLYEMYRRLRSRHEFWPSGDPDKDIKAALVQQDILPKWIPAFLELTYHPLGRIDTKRMLEQEVISQREAIDNWKQLGYSDENAERLARVTEAGMRKSAVKNPVVRRLASGEITQSEATQILRSENVPERLDPIVFRRATLEASASRRKKCIAGVKKRFMLGQIDNDRLEITLVSVGVELDAATNLAESMRCERASQGKETAAQQLQAWYIDGLLSSAEFQVRLLRIGYDSDDVTLMIRHANIIYARKEAKAEAQRRARNDAERRRLEADNRRDVAERKAREREARAMLREAENALKEQQRTGERTQSSLAALYVDSANKFSVPVDSAVQQVDSMFVGLVSQGFATTAEILSALAESLQAVEAEGFDSWRAAAVSILNSRVVVFPAVIT